jgi:hypothetical protein
VSAAGWRMPAAVTRGGLAVISAASVEQISRQREFTEAHPGSEFTPAPVGGLLLAWVPFGSGGVQFSGKTLEELLDAAEAFFRDPAQDPGG